jgi:putative transposase
MILITLDNATRDELRTLRRTDLAPKVRDRIEMVCLSDAGWSPPQIAAHLGCHPQTVRNLLRAFLGRGTAALSPFRSGPAPDTQRFDQIADVLRQLLGQDRTWTSRQLSQALAGCGIALGARQVRRYLQRLGSRYRRTASTLKHKQNPAQAERARRVLANLQAKAVAGRLQLYYLDECGFAPTLPTGASWTLPGQRKLIRYEAPQGRRVNAMAAYRPYGRRPRLDVITAERTWHSYDLLDFLMTLPAARCPRVVVLDNASLHSSAVIRQARHELARRGIYLYFLPAYSPELNEIEPVFRQVKYQEIPHRSHTSRRELRESVEDGFAGYGQRLPPKRPQQLRPAA